MERAGDRASEIELGARTYVDELRAGRPLQQFVGLARGQGSGVRQCQFLAPAMGGVEQFGDASHGYIPRR